MAIQSKHEGNALFQELGKNSEEALMRIHEQFFSQLMEYSFEIVIDKELAKEIAMDTLQILWQNRKTVASMVNPVGWLFKCAHHKSLNELKAKRRKNIVSMSGDYDPEGPGNIENELEAKELSSFINLAMEKLPAQQKKIIQLSKDYGMNRKEIARHCNISESTVKNQITEARRHLRNTLEQLFKNYFP